MRTARVQRQPLHRAQSFSTMQHHEWSLLYGTQTCVMSAIPFAAWVCSMQPVWRDTITDFNRSELFLPLSKHSNNTPHEYVNVTLVNLLVLFTWRGYHLFYCWLEQHFLKTRPCSRATLVEKKIISLTHFRCGPDDPFTETQVFLGASQLDCDARQLCALFPGRC